MPITSPPFDYLLKTLQLINSLHIEQTSPKTHPPLAPIPLKYGKGLKFTERKVDLIARRKGFIHDF